MLALALLLFGGGIAIHVEDTEAIETEAALALGAELARAIETRTGTAASIDEPGGGRCQARDRCVGEIRARTAATEVVLLRVFGGPRSIQLIAERIRPRLALAVQGKLTLERGGAAPLQLEPLAATLFPEVRASAPAPPIEAPPEHTSWVPWAIAGSGAVLAVAGAVLAASSAGAKARLEAEVLPEATSESLSDRQVAHGTAGAVLIPAGAAALLAGLAWLVLE